MIPECLQKMSFECSIMLGAKGIEFGLITGLIFAVFYIPYKLIKRRLK